MNRNSWISQPISMARITQFTGPRPIKPHVTASEQIIVGCYYGHCAWSKRYEWPQSLVCFAASALDGLALQSGSSQHCQPR